MMERAKKRIETKLFTCTRSLSDAIAPLITLNWILGIRAFEYPRHHLRRIISFCYVLFIYGIYMSGSLEIDSEYYSNITVLKLEYILYKLMAYVTICSVTMKLLLGWWHTQRFKGCQRKIAEIDKTLQQLGSEINNDKIYFIIIGTIICWSAITISMSAVGFTMEIRSNLYAKIYIVIAYSYSLTVNSIILFEFYIFVKCLQMRFESINKLLCENSKVSSSKEMKLGIFEMKDYTKVMNAEQPKNILSTKILSRWNQRMKSAINTLFVFEKENSVEPQIQSYLQSRLQKQFEEELQNQSRERITIMSPCEKRIHLLQTIRQVHLELRKVSKTVCTILGVQTAWEIAVTIMFLTGILYNLYIRYNVQQQQYFRSLTQETILHVALIIFHALRIIFLCRACQHTAHEGNKTIEIIHAIYRCGASNDMQDEIQQFGIQIMQSPVGFCAFGIYLDNHILSLTLKTVTIYLVIMIQVSNSLESDKSAAYLGS